MHFNLYNWLFEDPYSAGLDRGLSGAETFHYLWPWIIFCGLGLLIWFYYMVEGRKRFIKSNPILKRVFDNFLNWLAVICFIGLPLIFARVYMDGYFFAWRFWRYLWLVGLLVWGVMFVLYWIRKYPAERANFMAYKQRQRYIKPGKKARVSTR